MKSGTLSLKTIINELDFLMKTVVIQLTSGKKDLQLFLIELTEKNPDPCNAKEKYWSFLRKKKPKSVTQPKITTQQPKSFVNANIFYIKSVIIEHPKTSNKLSIKDRLKKFPK